MDDPTKAAIIAAVLLVGLLAIVLCLSGNEPKGVHDEPRPSTVVSRLR